MSLIFFPGVFLTILKNEKIREPFRRGLGYAAQWLDSLRTLVAEKMEEALASSDQVLQHASPLGETLDELAASLPPHYTDRVTEGENTARKDSSGDLAECTRTLRQLCPACFGCSSFGRSLEEYV
jgi:hypothetical protein